MDRYEAALWFGVPAVLAALLFLIANYVDIGPHVAAIFTP